jgi:hypothetical protein
VFGGKSNHLAHALADAPHVIKEIEPETCHAAS